MCFAWCFGLINYTRWVYENDCGLAKSSMEFIYDWQISNVHTFQTENTDLKNKFKRVVYLILAPHVTHTNLLRSWTMAKTCQKKYQMNWSRFRKRLNLWWNFDIHNKHTSISIEAKEEARIQWPIQIASLSIDRYSCKCWIQ